MQWFGWVVVSLGAIQFIYGFTVLLLTPGSILRKPRKIDKGYVYQAPMLRRHTDKRKSEARLEKAEWDLEFTKLDAHAAAITLLNYDVDANRYIPADVVKFAYKTDPVLFRKLMAHNQRVDIKNNVPLATVRDYND